MTLMMTLDLSQIKEISFVLEKDIQKIVYDNITSLFGLEFVASEFSLDGLRVDTLGFDIYRIKIICNI